jgi:hypothetical protein
MLDGKTAVQLRDVAAALSFHGDADSLVYLAGIMRSMGWRKAWVRADTVEPVTDLSRPNQLLLGQGGKS